jgi:hypothetical protein
VGLTACPGLALNAEIPQLRHDVQAKIDANGGAVEPPATP